MNLQPEIRGKGVRARKIVRLAPLTWGLLTILVSGLACSLKKEGGQDGDRADGSDLKGKLLLTGSSTMAPLMTAVGQRFSERHPGVLVEVLTGGSGRGISDARLGLADIGMASRALNYEESDLKGFPIARDGICLLVHKDNPVKSLGDDLIADIFRGKVTNWKVVGGLSAPITVIDRTPGRSEVEIFCDFFQIKHEAIRAQALAGENQEAIQMVAKDRQAITYISLGESVRSQRSGIAVKLLPIQRVAASKDEVRTGNYPLARPLTLVTKDMPTGIAKQFLEFALSSQVTDLIDEYNFIPYLD
jgi:phosphate transport system substrate-binding protein